MSYSGKEPTLDVGIPENSSSQIQIEECYATLDGARIRYLRAGSGPVVVLLHGLLGYSFSWRFTIPFLAQYATVYAVDLLGAGFSDRVPGLDCSLPAQSRRLLRFLDAIHVSQFDLVGTSHGGAVAMMMAAACAEDSSQACRLRRLILVDPVNPWSARGRTWAPFLASPFGSLLFLHGLARMPLVHDYALRRLYGDPKRISPGTLEGYSAPYKVPGTFEYGLSVARCWLDGLRELEAALPKISHYPTLLIWGSLDRAVYPGSAARLQSCFKHAELIIFDGVGHLPYEEVPDAFNRAVLKFLQAPAQP